MFYFDGKEFANYIDDNDKDLLLVALEYDGKIIKSIILETYGYYNITFEDGMKLDAISELHIKRKN